MKRVRPFWAHVVLVAAIVCPSRAANTFLETFSTTTYKDPVNTTADWNTTAGALRLLPFTPTVLGTANTPGNAVRVAVSGRHAFVGDEGGGFKVVDISNPNAPAIVGSLALGSDVYGISIDGDYAYVAAFAAGLKIVNISNPAAPTLVGTYDTVGIAFDVAVAGDHAYVADWTAGLMVVNIINPAAPTLAGSYNTAGSAIGVAVSGDHAYVADWTSGLAIINVANPSAPSLLGTAPTPSAAADVAFWGDYVLVSAAGLRIFNATNPAAPVLVGSNTSPAFSQGLFVDGDHAFVAEGSGLFSIDISDPTAPVVDNTYPAVSGGIDVAVAGDFAYCADGATGLLVLRFRDGMTPVELGNLPNFSRGVFVAGRYAYTANETDGLAIVDVSDPSSPMPTGNLFTAGSYNVWVSGDYAFAAGLAAGLRVINVSNPAAPVEVAVHDTPGAAHDVVVKGDLAYVADDTSLRVINVSNPAAPSSLGSYSVNAYELAVAGDHAFVAAGNSGLQVINVSNPATPTFAGSFDDGRFVLAVVVSGDFAYLAANSPNAFQVVDITNPSAPVLAATYTRPISDFAGISVAGTHVYLAAGDFGIDVIDVSNPAAPTSVGTFDSGEIMIDIFVSGDFAYSVGTAATRILRVQQDDFVQALHNVGQSTLLPITNTVTRLRLNPTQTGTVNWGVYAGATLSQVPVNQWVELTPSDQIKWRSTHQWSAPGVNPSVSELLVDWRTTSGDITALTDVPNDQGGWVRLEMLRSGYDFAGEPTPIVQYFIQRQFDDAAVLSAAANSVADRQLLPEALASWPAEKPLLEWQGRFFTLDHAPHGSAALAWEVVGSLPAIQQDVQFISVPTLADAGPGASPTVYRILAQSSAPGVFYTSPTISGFSIDNIAPGVPQGLVLAYNAPAGNLLTWDPSEDDDFQYFRIYRHTDPNFTPSPENLVHATAGTSWNDPDYHAPGVYYKVTALDYVGNESDPAVPELVTDVGAPTAPVSAALYQNQPNPFNPTTRIRYDVPAPGAQVDLAVYDVAGRLVRMLLSRNESAGRKAAEWDGRNDDGASVASGVYMYRITIGSFAETRKMVLLK